MAETPKRLRVRAHHLLCIQGFQGLGYSDKFVQNMGEICRQMKAESALEIEVVDNPDDICAPCPFVAGGCCSREEGTLEQGARELDRRVLEKLEISPGRIFRRDELLALVLKKISPDDLEVLCEGCEWLPFDYCREGLREKGLKIE
jgi:uncharacterized protein